MVTLHLLEYLRQAGFGTALDTDLFFEKLPLGKTGVAIYSVGGPRAIGRTSAVQVFDLECRGESDTIGMDTLEKIALHLSENFSICDLPIIPDVSHRVYRKCRITQISNITNLGSDENDRVIFKLTARINYKKEAQ